MFLLERVFVRLFLLSNDSIDDFLSTIRLFLLSFYFEDSSLSLLIIVMFD
jgi:hypothetical protein